MTRLLLLLVLTHSLLAQTAPPAGAPPLPPSPGAPQQEADPVPGSPEMNSSQRTRFAQAGRIFNEGHFADALAEYKRLRTELPDDVNVAKFTAEAAINTGDPALAVATLRPFEAAEPDDWQIVSILAHAYAQGGQAALRDTEVERLRTLHQRLGPPFSTRRDFLLETVAAGDHTIRFFPALAPWGAYQVHLLARVYNAAGDQVLRVTLESPDFDQANFASQHPAEAAKGARAFSLDGYPPDKHNPAGQIVQTHLTYRFYEGQPSYDAMRADVLAVVAGKLHSLSSSQNTGTR